MRLRVRIAQQTSRVELEGEGPTLTDLTVRIKEILLPSHGLSPETEFTLSLNGSERLCDEGQTLASCGIVPGDLICVALPQSCPEPSPSPPAKLQALCRSSMHPESVRHPDTTAAQHPDETGASCSHSSPTEAKSNTEERIGFEEEEEKEAAPGPFVPEPMLCSETEEGKVPHSLQLLHHTGQCRGPTDCLVVALHLLMMETGFVPQGSEGRLAEMPPGWQAAGGVYRFQYAHPLCENSQTVMAAIPMGATLVINASLKMSDTVNNARKLTLKPSSYVTDNWADENITAVYRDLRKLSHIFKDQLVYPLMASARQAMGLPALFGLPVLPPELLLRILRLLDVASLVALSSVSRDLNIATEDPSLWRHLYRRDFRATNSQQAEARDTNWKELYKKRFKQRKEMGRYRAIPHPYMIPPIFPLHPRPYAPILVPIYPPGIIGGEYDERPGIPHGILPSPRYDPIGPLPGHDLDHGVGLPFGRQPLRPGGNRPANIRRGFI